MSGFLELALWMLASGLFVVGAVLCVMEYLAKSKSVPRHCQSPPGGDHLSLRTTDLNTTLNHSALLRCILFQGQIT